MLDEEPDFPGTDYEDQEKLIKMANKLGPLKVNQIEKKNKLANL